MITHSVKQAIANLKVGDVLNYYIEGPGIPIQIRTIHITLITSTEIHFTFTRNNKEVYSKMELSDDLTDIKHVCYN